MYLCISRKWERLNLVHFLGIWEVVLVEESVVPSHSRKDSVFWVAASVGISKPKMEGSLGIGFLGVMVCLGVFVSCSCAQSDGDNVTAVYIVTLKQAPTPHYYDELRAKRNGSDGMNRLDKPR